jgi:quercetin dioxygenase-like cupin family protein
MGTVATSSTTAVGHELIEGTLSVPVLQFDLGEEIDQRRMQDSWLHGVGRSSKTLVKYDDLRIVLISMRANTVMLEHKAAARISIQTLTGHIQLRVVGRTVDLPAGHLVMLDQSLPHDVIALKNSSFLLTLSWPAERNSEPGSCEVSIPCECDFNRWAD